MTEIRTTSSTGGQKGVKLAKHSLIPPGPLNALAEHYGVGAFKYADHQWRKGYEYSKSYDALQRHATEWLAGKSHDTCSNANWEGCQDVDADGNDFTAPRDDACYNHTGSHHMSAVAWHAFCIQEFEAEYPEHDDRYGADLRRELEAAERFAPFQDAVNGLCRKYEKVIDDFAARLGEESIRAMETRRIEFPPVERVSAFVPRFTVDTGGIVMDDDEDGPMTVAESFRDAMERVFRRR